MITADQTDFLVKSITEITNEQEDILFQFWSILIKFFKDEACQNITSPNNISEIYHRLSRSHFDTDDMSLGSLKDNCKNVWIKEEFWCQTYADDPDTMLIRFLKGWKWNLLNAFEGLVSCLLWRKDFKVQKLVSEGEDSLHQASLKAGKFFLYNRDRLGRTCLYIRVRLHDKDAQVAEEVLKQFVYFAELGRRCGSQQAVVVFDLTDVGRVNLDITLAKLIVTKFQENYPEGLGKWIILGAPWFFRGFWTLLKCVMDAEVVEKVSFLENPSELNQFFSMECLASEYGGVNTVTDAYHDFEPIGDKRVLELSEAEMQLLERDKAFLLAQFERMTLEICANMDSRSDLGELLSHRQSVKVNLREIIGKLEMATMKPSVLHRLGIMRSDGTIAWPT